MKKYKHTQKWYENVHDTLAGLLLVGGIAVLILICGLLENI